MRHRPVVTLLMFMIAMILALPARAWPKPVAPTPAPAGSAKPFTHEQVQAMVRAGLGDETGAKAIEQRGLDFAPTDDLLQSLKAAGPNEAFLQALRVAKHLEPRHAKKSTDKFKVRVSSAPGEPIHGGYFDIDSGKFRIDDLIALTRHLHDLLVRVILKIIKYDATYQPTVLVGTTCEAVDWVKSSTPVRHLGYSQRVPATASPLGWRCPAGLCYPSHSRATGL